MNEMQEKGLGWMKYALAASSLLISFIFIRTSCPTVFLGDSGEMVAAAYTLGIGHPPGYPLFMLLVKIASWLPLGDVAFRANLFASFLAVLVFIAMYLTSLAVVQIVFRKKPDLYMKLAALFTAYVFVLSYMFWFEAGQAKGGVYLLSHLAGLLGMLFCLKFIYEKKAKYFYLAAFTAGFMPAIHHSMGVIMIFILMGLALNMKKLRARQKVFGAVFFLLSFLTAYLYLFLRIKAAPVVSWGSMETAAQVMNHIIRKVYSTIPRGPFGMDVVLFKLRHYSGQFIYSYKIAALLAAAGLAFIFMNSRKLFFIFLGFIVLDLGGLFYLTGYSYSPFNIYMNGGFFLIVDAVLMLAAGTGAYGLLNLINKKRGKIIIAAAAALFIIPVFNVFSFYPAIDMSRKFMAYDNTMNDFRTLKDGDMLFAEEDFQVFNILYFKVVRHMFPGIRAYDRSSNYLDTSIFKPFRDLGMEKKFTVKAHNKSELDYMMMQYTAKLERAAEYGVIMNNPGKIYYTGIPDFEALKLISRPYGILYKIGPEKEKHGSAEALMQLYTIRDYFNNRKLDLYYRDVIGRYFIQRAKYAAQKGSEVDFSYYRSWGENFAGGSGSVLNLIAEIYYTDLKDMPWAIRYMEKIMQQNPYDFSALDILVRFCLEADREKALIWLRHYYKIAMTAEMQNTILVQINKLNEEFKKR
jgi:hypothetical protein